MRISLFAFLAVALIGVSLRADGLAEGYTKTFGYGTVVASGQGYPPFGEFKPEMFNFKDGRFRIKAGASITLDLRSVLPKEMTVGQYVEKIKKDRPGNLKYWKEDVMVFQIWYSHDPSGKELSSKDSPWPAKLGDLPAWSPRHEQFYTVSDESKNWVGAGVQWDNIKSDVWDLKDLKPGQKLYVVYRIGYRYKTAGGEMENKWDSDLKKFVPVPSVGMIGYEYTEPLGACLIELTE